MFIHLFGATTPSGEAFGNLIADNNSFKLFSYSRNNDSLSHADLVDPGRFKPGGPSTIQAFGLALLLYSYLLLFWNIFSP